jgi:hypothetical protein
MSETKSSRAPGTRDIGVERGLLPEGAVDKALAVRSLTEPGLPT